MLSAGGPIFFFREHEQPHGFLSQWYNSPFTASPPSTSMSEYSMAFLTTEQYMMYHKAIAFKDQEIADAIMLEPRPHEQKALGRKVKGFDNNIWNEKREQVVRYPIALISPVTRIKLGFGSYRGSTASRIS